MHYQDRSWQWNRRTVYLGELRSVLRLSGSNSMREQQGFLVEFALGGNDAHLLLLNKRRFRGLRVSGEQARFLVEFTLGGIDARLLLLNATSHHSLRVSNGSVSIAFALAPHDVLGAEESAGGPAQGHEDGKRRDSSHLHDEHPSDYTDEEPGLLCAADM